MPRIKKLNQSEGRNIERQRAAWELFRHGATYAEIARSIGVHRSHAYRLVGKERERLTGEIQTFAHEHLTDELSRTDFQIREASRIALAKCPACEGRGRILPDGPATLPGQDDVCVSCDGSGRKYSPDLILKAIDRINRAVEQRGKLLGLFKDSRTVDVTFHDGRDAQLMALLMAMDDDELQRELADLAVPDVELPVIEVAPVQAELMPPPAKPPGYFD